MTFSVNGNTVITSDRIVQLTTGATGSRPLSPVTGQLFFDTTLNKVIVWNGTAWREPATTGAVDVPPAWAWGENTTATADGRLGDNTSTDRSSPVSVVGGFTNWIQISAGSYHTAAIRANGQAWCWGRNNYGQLGETIVSNRSSPVSVVGGITDWIQISGGSGHTTAIRANGTAWAWGAGGQGRLGDGTTTNKASPVSVVGGFTDWVQISAGGYCTLAIRANGTAWAWGNGSFGRLGTNSTASQSSPVSVAGGFTDWIQIGASNGAQGAAVRANGTIWTWGFNNNGQLGDNTSTGKSSPVAVVGGFTDWVQVSPGYNHMLATRANGTAWGWGFNGGGRIGDGTTTTRLSPVSVVGGFTDWVQVCAGTNNSSAGLRANGTAWTWGANSKGQLGTGQGTNITTSSPVSVIGGFTDWMEISLKRHVVALRSQPRTQTIRPGNQRSVNTL